MLLLYCLLLLLPSMIFIKAKLTEYSAAQTDEVNVAVNELPVPADVAVTI